MKSWVLAAAVVVTCTWVARPLAGSSIESDTESAANAAAGIASVASTAVEETASQRNLRAIVERRRLSMNPPYPAIAAASARAQRPWKLLTHPIPHGTRWQYADARPREKPTWSTDDRRREERPVHRRGRGRGRPGRSRTQQRRAPRRRARYAVGARGQRWSRHQPGAAVRGGLLRVLPVGARGHRARQEPRRLRLHDHRTRRCRDRWPTGASASRCDSSSTPRR